MLRRPIGVWITSAVVLALHSYVLVSVALMIVFPQPVVTKTVSNEIALSVSEGIFVVVNSMIWIVGAVLVLRLRKEALPLYVIASVLSLAAYLIFPIDDRQTSPVHIASPSIDVASLFISGTIYAAMVLYVWRLNRSRVLH